MNFEILDHRNGFRSVSSAERMGVENLLEKIAYPDGVLSSKEVLEPIKDGLTALGWSGKVAIGQGTNISINGVHADVGMAIQLGNVSRIYADLMKFQALYFEEKIASGIIIVPHKDMVTRLSKSGGTDNRCTFNRLARELPIFSKVITMPILVYGIYTKEVEDAEQ